jgi:micrococcal nuclease
MTGVASLTAYMVSTNPATSQQQALSKTNCDPSYPGICIPQNSPNLKCADIKERNFKVLKPDPHGFDRDGNGIGCEK